MNGRTESDIPRLNPARIERMRALLTEAFAPQLLFVSAGFDAHRDDPLAQGLLETDDFAWITTQLVGIAKRHARGRIVSTLEGGYDLAALAASAVAHVSALRD